LAAAPLSATSGSSAASSEMAVRSASSGGSRAAAAQQRLERPGQPARRREPRAEVRRLRRVRPLATPEQRGHLLERHGARQLADLVAPIKKPPRRAVDGADGRARAITSRAPPSTVSGP